MGVRVIGVDKGVTGRVQPIEAGNGVSEPTVSFVPVGEQYVFDEPNNDGESDTNGQSSDFIDPTTIDSDSSGTTAGTGKRRGRKPGSKNGTRTGASTRSTSKTTDSVAAMLFTIHSVAGAVLKIPSIRIPKSGCEELAAAILEVTELYEVPLLSEKGMAWANLAAVATKVYVFDSKQTIKVDKPNVVNNTVQMPDFMRR